MKFSFKKAILSGLLSVSVLASSLVAAIPVAAANPVTITIAPQNLAGAAVNDTFTVPVRIATALSGDSGVAGAQFNMSFDASKLECQTVSYSNSPKVFGDAQSNVTVTIANGRINNAAGTISNVTSTTGGDPAIAMDGVWLNIVFKVKQTNTVATLILQPFNSKYAIDKFNNIIPTDTTNGVITLGSPVYPDLTVAGITSGTGATYDLTATVTNNGTAAIAAGTTIQSTYAINGGSAVNFSDIVLAAPLAVGASVTTTATGLAKADVLTAGNTDTIALATDTANVVDEGANEGNNTNTTSYSVYPNLVISAVSTTPDQDTVAEGEAVGAVNNYVVNYTVANTGIGIAAASSTQIKVNGSQVGTLSACAALNPAASLSFTTASITIGGSHDEIVVIADLSAVVTETSELDNSNTEDFYFIQSGSDNEDNDINGTLPLVFAFTSPGNVNAWNPTTTQAFSPGVDNTDYPGNLTMEVVCSKVWDVSTKAQNDGFLTKWKTGTGYDTDTQLHNRLKIAAGTDQASIGTASHNLTGTLIRLANGDTMGLTGVSGYSRTIAVDYTQPITYSDTTLTDGFTYHTVVTFNCTASDY